MRSALEAAGGEERSTSTSIGFDSRVLTCGTESGCTVSRVMRVLAYGRTRTLPARPSFAFILVCHSLNGGSGGFAVNEDGSTDRGADDDEPIFTVL